MRFVFIVLLLLMNGIVFAQDKIEIEKRVKTEDVPKSAVEDLADILGADHKVKWYYQEDGSKKVYEAKFNFNSNDYSVEFDTNALIYNVEIEVDFESLTSKFRLKLEKKLNKLFEDYKIRKIQIEYLGEEEDLFELISEEDLDEDLEIRYEIEVNAKSSKQRALYELIFDDNAKLMSKRKIKLKSTDILDY